jgi:hypothetical protein
VSTYSKPRRQALTLFVFLIPWQHVPQRMRAGHSPSSVDAILCSWDRYAIQAILICTALWPFLRFTLYVCMQSDWDIVQRGWKAHVLGEAGHSYTDPIEAIKDLKVDRAPLQWLFDIGIEWQDVRLKSGNCMCKHTCTVCSIVPASCLSG